LSPKGGSVAALLELRERMTQLFDELVHPLEPSATPVAWSPTADVVETPDAFEICLELAGVDPESVQVECHGRIVTIRGTRPFPSESCEAVHRMERRYGPFLRAIELPAEVQAEGATRRSEDGVLRLAVLRVRVPV
jgi:HSP20 family protein